MLRSLPLVETPPTRIFYIHREPQETEMIKTIVIGAGVMGASVAYRLAQAGAAVTVLEGTRIGGGTSGISFAWTNAHRKPPKPYHDLNVAGMKAHAALAEEFGATPWCHGGGSLEWEAEADRAAQAENIEQLRSWGYAAEWITLRQVQELEPDIDPATIGDAPVAFYPEEGWLDPVVYAHAMLSAVRLRHREEDRLACAETTGPSQPSSGKNATDASP